MLSHPLFTENLHVDKSKQEVQSAQAPTSGRPGTALSHMQSLHNLAKRAGAALICVEPSQCCSSAYKGVSMCTKGRDIFHSGLLFVLAAVKIQEWQLQPRKHAWTGEYLQNQMIVTLLSL